MLMGVVVASIISSTLSYLWIPNLLIVPDDVSPLERHGAWIVIEAFIACALVWSLPLVLALVIRSPTRLAVACFVGAVVDALLTWSIYLGVSAAIGFYVSLAFFFPISVLLAPMSFMIRIENVLTNEILATLAFLVVFPVVGLLFAKTCRLQENDREIADELVL